MRIARQAAMAAIAALVAAPPVCGAQVAASIDAATSGISYDSGGTVGLLGITPTVIGRIGPADLSLTGTLAARASGGTASRGAEHASVPLGAAGPLVFDASASSGWDAVQPSASTGYWRGEMRVRVPLGAGGGAWLSAGAGRALEQSSWHPLTTVSGGAWRRIGSATLEASLTSARWSPISQQYFYTVDTPTSEAIPGTDSVQTVHHISAESTWVRTSASTTDAQATLRWTRGPLALAMTGGRRLAGGGAMWGEARAMLRLGPQMALVAAGGSSPLNLVDGSTARRYVTLGVHFVPHLRARAGPAPPGVGGARPGAGRRPALEVEEVAGAERELRLRLGVRASSVEIMGDFTGWTPVAMRSDGTDGWVATLSIPAGAHRVNVRVDGGAWRVPPGLPRIPDDFGGAAGVLIVSQ